MRVQLFQCAVCGAVQSLPQLCHCKFKHRRHRAYWSPAHEAYKGSDSNRQTGTNRLLLVHNWQSPCGSEFTENCQKNFFQFAYKYIFCNYDYFNFTFHSLAVAFEWWFTGKVNTPIKTVKTFSATAWGALSTRMNRAAWISTLASSSRRWSTRGMRMDDAIFNPGNGSC